MLYTPHRKIQHLDIYLRPQLDLIPTLIKIVLLLDQIFFGDVGFNVELLDLSVSEFLAFEALDLHCCLHHLTP